MNFSHGYKVDDVFVHSHKATRKLTQRIKEEIIFVFPFQPRAPISADFQTPGPGSFNIPTTIGKNANQMVKGKSPAYTFGAK